MTGDSAVPHDSAPGWWEAELAALDELANDPTRGDEDHLAGVGRLHQRAEAELRSTHPVTLALLAEGAAFFARAPRPRRPEGEPRFPDGLPPAAATSAGLAALAARVTSTTSARVRARLADLLWESGSEEHRRAALLAPVAYLDLARLLRRAPRDAMRDLQITDALRRSGELALATGKKEVADSVAAEAIDCLEEALAERSLGTVVDMAVTLGGVRSRLTSAQAELMLDRLQAAMDLWRQQDRLVPPFQLAWLHEVRRQVLLTLGREADARAEDLAAAADFADFATRVGSGLVAQGYLDSAITYAERGQASPQLLNRYRSRRRQAVRAGMAEMKPVVTSGTLPAPLSAALDAERQMLAALPLPDLIEHLSRSFLVTREQCTKMVEWAETNTPLTARIPRSVVSGPGSTVGPGRDQARVLDIGRLMLAVSDGSLVHVWADLRSRTDVHPLGFAAYLVGIDAVPEESGPLIDHGMERAWAEDYASALHILIPQLEGALRHLLEKAGHDPMRRRPTDPQVTEEITLSSIVQGLVDAETMTEDEAWLIHLVLDEPAGLNLRNRIAHGLVVLAELTAERFVRVLQLYCIAASVAQRKSQGGQEPAPGASSEGAG